MFSRFYAQFLTRHFWQKLVWVFLFASGFCVFTILSVSAWRANTRAAKKMASTTTLPKTPMQSGSFARDRLFSRLALQPQADRFRRRLGQRFLASGREVSVLVGTVNVANERYTLRLTRSRDEDDERLTIVLNGGASTLTWSGTDGSRLNNNAASGILRALAERLALDSPDQFILAQLRGASYFNVAQNVRPSGAPDNYTGPIWNVIRVTEPVASLSATKPQSTARLYLINSTTGLIDKIVSQEGGLTITAELSDWVNQNNELSPSRIVWKQGQQIIMEFAFTSVSHNTK